MNKIQDLTGNRYGKLTVLTRVPHEIRKGRGARWECKCDCGNITVVSAANLKQHTRSCGCGHREAYKGFIYDEVGNRHGRLTVLGFDKIRNGKAWWLCRCDCGNEHSASGAALRNGNVKSCGCLTHEPKRRLAKGQGAFNNLYYRYGRMASKRGYPFKLTIDEFRKLTSGACYYCGAPPIREHTGGHSMNGGYLYNGVDRVDNSKGYLPSNCVPCCHDCNSAKNSVTKKMIEKAYRFLHPQAG